MILEATHLTDDDLTAFVAGEGPHTHLVVETSGSSGTPKRVLLTSRALRASGEATAARLGGHGRWILALPPQHVAGLQVRARAALAGTTPLPLPAGMPFGPEVFAAAVDQLLASADGRAGAPLHLTSLVPTQLHRLLADDRGTRAAARLDAVLLGGAAADPVLLERARTAGVNAVTTYGMSETCGGCVYDGVPLDGVRVHLEDDGRVLLGGPVLADGYADSALTAERFVERDGERWFITDDRGRWDVDEAGSRRLHLLGRLDDVIVTGGHKVEPRDVENALRRLPAVADAIVLGLPDDEWGQVVAALVAPAPGADGPDLAGLREALDLPAHARPRVLAVARDGIPLLVSGKPDRLRARDLLTASRAAQ